MAELTYARWLEMGTRIALAALVAAFVVYMLGLLPPWVPFAELPALWGMPAERYLATTGSPAGWGWVRLLAYGDYLSLAGVALLCSVTVACYLRLALLARAERLQAALALAQVLVLLAAASGILAGGH